MKCVRSWSAIRTTAATTGFWRAWTTAAAAAISCSTQLKTARYLRASLLAEHDSIDIPHGKHTFDPYSKHAKSLNARVAAEEEPEPSRPSMGRRTLSERNALRMVRRA